MRECKKCSIEKEIEMFVKNKNSLLWYEYTCKKCKTNNRRVKRRKEWVVTYKERWLLIRWENNPNWKWWIWIRETIRKSREYLEWRTKCFHRDRFTCQISWRVWWELVVHHLFPFYIIINDLSEDTFRDDEKLFNIDNWITISKDLHNDFHNKYWKKWFTKEQFITFKEEWQIQKQN